MVAEFNDYFWDLARLILDLVQAKQGSVIVRMAKVIEAEERLDEQVNSPRVAESAALMMNPDRISVVGRKPKGYLSKFKEVLQETIAARFQEAVAPFTNDLIRALDRMDFVIEDLTIAYDEIAPLFPRRWGIFPFFVLRYHIHVYELLNRIVTQYLDAGSILRLLKWVRDYYDDMASRLGVSEEVLMPELLDGREQQLVDDYLKMIRKKLDEWMGNLFATEVKAFCAREEPPEENNGFYGMASPVIMFQMVNQQIDIAVATGRDRLLYDVVRECCRSLEEFQTKWLSTVDSEFEKLISKPQEAPKGFPEYTMALANDSYRATEFTELVVKKVDPFAAEEFRDQMIQSLGSTQDGFMRVARRAYTLLIDVAFNDAKPAFAQLHTQQWYEDDSMKLVLGTLEDYCNDYQAHLQEYLFSKLVGDMLDRFVVLYLEAFRSKGAKYRAGACGDRLKRDLRDAEEFFIKFKPEKRVKQAFEAIEKLVAVIASQPSLLFLDAYALWKAFPDMRLSYLEEVLSKRDDLDKSQLQDVGSSMRFTVHEDLGLADRFRFSHFRFSRTCAPKRARNASQSRKTLPSLILVCKCNQGHLESRSLSSEEEGNYTISNPFGLQAKSPLPTLLALLVIPFVLITTFIPTLRLSNPLSNFAPREKVDNLILPLPRRRHQRLRPRRQNQVQCRITLHTGPSIVFTLP